MQCSLKFCLTNSPFFLPSFQSCHAFITVWRLFSPFCSPRHPTLSFTSSFHNKFLAHLISAWHLLLRTPKLTYLQAWNLMRTACLIPFGLSWSYTKRRDWNYLKTDSRFWHLKLALGYNLDWVCWRECLNVASPFGLGFLPYLIPGPRVLRQKESGRSHITFYDLAAEVTQLLIYRILLVTQSQLWLDTGGNHTCTLLPRSVNHWGPSWKLAPSV